MSKRIKLEGKQFSEWTVEAYEGNGKYTCRCSCGRVASVDSGNLLSGASTKCKLCGPQKLRQGEAAFHFLLREYQDGARKRGFVWDLTEEEARTLFLSNCHYCNKGLYEVPVYSKILGKFNGTFYFNGIDRIDNDKGYVSGNVVTCCGVCNRAKNDMGYEDFMCWIDRIRNRYRPMHCVAETAASVKHTVN